jgi:DNA-directed RNA polymerase subunit L
MSKSKTKLVNDRVNISEIIETESIDGFATNNLTFVMSGSQINHIFSNTIIRTIDSLVGAFAFDKTDIDFTSNTSIFNRDYMRVRISNTPILYKNYEYDAIDNFAETCVELEKARKNVNNERVLTDIEQIDELNKKKLSMINNIHMFVDAKNDTNDIIHVTTNSKFTTFHKDEKIIPDIYPREVKLCALKPGQEIKISAISSFNIPLERNCYSSAITTFHREIDANTYKFKLVSLRQMREKQIVIEACKIINLKIMNIKNKLISKINSLKSTTNIDYNAKIEIANENHTMGELLSRRLREHAFITYATFKMEHPDKNAIVFEYKAEGMTIGKILDTVVDEIIADYNLVIVALS